MKPRRNIRKISAESIKKVFGVDLTGGELDQIVTDAKVTELTPEMLEAVSGGGWKAAITNAIGCAIGGFGIGSVTGGLAGSVIPGVGSVIGFAVGGAAGFVAGGVAGAVEGALMKEPD